MPDTMVLLQIDHRNMGRLLDALDQQQARLASGAPVNQRLLDAAFAYLAGYPDQCHHPKEDLVYRTLLARDPGMASSLSDLAKEHAQLAGLTRDVRRAVAGPLARADGPGLADQLGEFLRLYRHHLFMEEQHFFPAALERLLPDDWAAIDFALFDQPDPLFDREAEADFAELRNEITRLGLAENTPAAELDEAALLAALEDIAAFNTAMERRGERLRLRRSWQGGYRLERDGSTLADIPECSESRAAWCAHFFWRAMAHSDGSAGAPSAGSRANPAPCPGNC